jgi:hypothetical protein
LHRAKRSTPSSIPQSARSPIGLIVAGSRVEPRRSGARAHPASVIQRPVRHAIRPTTLLRLAFTVHDARAQVSTPPCVFSSPPKSAIAWQSGLAGDYAALGRDELAGRVVWVRGGTRPCVCCSVLREGRCSPSSRRMGCRKKSLNSVPSNAAASRGRCSTSLRRTAGAIGSASNREMDSSIAVFQKAAGVRSGPRRLHRQLALGAFDSTVEPTTTPI